MPHEIPSLAQCREDFPMLQKTMHGYPLVYLDSAATTQKPWVVIKAVEGFYRDHYATVLRAIYELADQANHLFQQARLSVQRFINAPTPEEIIFTRGTTDAINMMAYSYGKAFIKPGDYVLITEMEHHSNLVPWQFMCEDRGAKLIVAPFDEKGDLDLHRFQEMLNEFKPKICAVTQVSNVLGTVNPIKEIAKMAHDAGAHILVDGAQATPHMPVDVKDLDVDFYTFSGHKIYGPNGVGVLYGKAELLKAMPPTQGGGAMVDVVTFEKTTFDTIPYKFEAGTMMLAEIIGLGAAVDYVRSIGFDKILPHERDLVTYAYNGMKNIPGMQIIGNPTHRESLISFTIQGVHSLDIGTMLDLKGVAIRTGNHCAQPLVRKLGLSSAARVSFGLYNTREDVDCFIQALEHSLTMLR